MAPASTEIAADSGITLQKRVLSTPEVLAQSVANMAPSAAMALLPFLVFLSAGNGTWLSFGISMVVLLIVAYCAAQFATRINSAGSFYVWVTRALGPGAGSAAGWGLILGYVFTGIACVIGFEIYGNNFLSGFGLSSPTNHAVKAVLYVVGGVVPALMAVSDIKFSQRLAFILESVSVTIILILCIAVYVHNGGVFDAHQLSLKGSSGGGIVVGMVLAIFAFVGFESAGALGQEAKNPARSVPRAIIWSCAIIGVFYLIVAYTQVYGFGDAAFGNATAPLPQLAARVDLGWLGHFIAIGITCSMFAWSVAIPMTVVPVAYILAGSTDTTLTGEEGTIATYGFMLAYGLVCLAMPIYLRKIGENKPLAWALGILGAVTMVFVFYVNWIPTVIPNHIFAALTWPWWTFPYVFLAWTALGLIAYLYVKMRRPEVINAAGP